MSPAQEDATTLELDQLAGAEQPVFRGPGAVPGIAPWHTSKASALPYPIGQRLGRVALANRYFS